MPKAKPTAAPAEETVAETATTENTAAPEVETENEESTGAPHVTVLYHHPTLGLTERTFSQDVHGKKFKEVAKVFADKFEGTIQK